MFYAQPAAFLLVGMTSRMESWGTSYFLAHYCEIGVEKLAGYVENTITWIEDWLNFMNFYMGCSECNIILRPNAHASQGAWYNAEGLLELHKLKTEIIKRQVEERNADYE